MSKSSLSIETVLTSIYRRFLEARRRDPEDALKQLQEAAKFQADRQVLRLYDLISVKDYEETRKLVC